eukprot:398106_1
MESEGLGPVNGEHDLDVDDLSVELEDDDVDSIDIYKNAHRLVSTQTNCNTNDNTAPTIVSNHSNHKWVEHEEFEACLTECLTISKSKISKLTELSMKYLHRYKDIVHYIEKFIRKGKTLNNTKLPQLFIIDSICRAEVKDDTSNHNKFIKRFGRNIDKTFHALCRGPPSDKASIKRMFTLWNKERWFPNDTMKGIMAIIQTFRMEADKLKIKSKHKSKRKHKKKLKKKSKPTDDTLDNGLLKSLQSLTNNTDDEDEEEGDHDMQIKLERLKAATRRETNAVVVSIGSKRKINHGFNATAPPHRKKIKLNDNNNINHQNQMNHNALHHIMPQPQQPARHQTVNPMGSMMNSHSHYMYSHAPPPPPHGHPYMFGSHSQALSQSDAQSHSQHHQYGIGWELSPDQLGTPPDRYRVLSCTIYVGFWNDVHVDIDKLRQEGNEFGPVLKIMPHPTKPPHKHAFVQFGSRVIAESAKSGLRKRFNHLQFVQKVGWGRPPKLVKESFKFDTGIGEILRSEAPHIHFGAQQQSSTQMQTLSPQAAQQPSNPNTNFVNIERQQLINATGNTQYTQQPMQYNPYNAYPQPQPQPHHP